MLDISTECDMMRITNGGLRMKPRKKKTNKHQTEIFEYIRRRKAGRTHKIGVVFGMVDKGVIKIGWSKCNTKLDKFNPEDGIAMAHERAIHISSSPDHIKTPDCIRTQVRQFGARCVRYFKDAQRLELPV